MADITITAPPAFPPGTNLSVYPDPEGDVPVSGPAVTTGVVGSDSRVRFQGLSAGRPYQAGAQVGGRWVGVLLLIAPSPQLEDPVSQLTEDDVVLRARAPYNVKDYGAIGDGVTNDTGAINAAVAAAMATGGVVLFPWGIYKITSQINCNASNVSFDMTSGAQIDFSGASSASSCIASAGTEGAAVPLTADVSAGATAVSIAPGAEAGWAPGDLVGITSTRKYDPGYTDTPDGEISVVASTGSGVLNLQMPLNGANYTVANLASVTKITPVRGFTVRGGKLIGLTGTSHKGVKISLAVKARVLDTECLNCPVSGVWLADAVIDGQVRGVHVEGSNSAISGYGINVSSRCQDCRVEDCWLYDCEHCTTVTGGGQGIARRITFDGNYGINTIASGDDFDSHACAEDIHFRNCHSYDSGNCGFQLECARGSIVGCTVYRSANHCVRWGNSTAAPTEITISDNTFDVTTGASAGGIRVDSSSLVGGGSNQRYVKIADNRISRTVGRALYVASTDTWRFANVSITGNVIDSPGDAVDCIQLQKADQCVVAYNTVLNAQSGSSAIRLHDVTRTVVEGNNTSHVAIGASRSINVTSCDRITFVGNIGDNANIGLALDSLTTNCTMGDNDFATCTTRYSLSTGAGHRFQTATPDAVQTLAADAGITLTPFTSPELLIHTGTLTANRTVTLSTTNAVKGMKFRIARSGAGAFSLNVGTGPLKALATGQWCEVTYDGAAWVLTAFGSL